MIKVVYVEKRKPFNVEARQLFDDFKINLKIDKLTNVRLLNKYIIADIDNNTYQKSLYSIFSEPPTDNLYEEKFEVDKNETPFGVTYLPGQFDQRADSAEQCLKLINPNSKATVKTVTIIILEGSLSQTQLESIKKYYINPIDSQEVDPYSQEHNVKIALPKNVETINYFIDWTQDQISKFHNDNSLSMSIEDLLLTQTYFQKEKRNPTITEIKVIDTY
jgi:phosphoribosylformylglycinamidine synthase